MTAIDPRFWTRRRLRRVGAFLRDLSEALSRLRALYSDVAREQRGLKSKFRVRVEMRPLTTEQGEAWIERLGKLRNVESITRTRLKDNPRRWCFLEAEVPAPDAAAAYEYVTSACREALHDLDIRVEDFRAHALPFDADILED